MSRTTWRRCQPGSTYLNGDPIGFLLDDDWQVFSGAIQVAHLVEDLAVSILEAHSDPKDRFDYPSYDGLFRHYDNSLEAAWDQRAYAAFTADKPNSSEATTIATEIAVFAVSTYRTD